MPNLLIAATAELTGLVVHHDKEFNLLAEVTGQPVAELELAG